jgi:hypothetical protein
MGCGPDEDDFERHEMGCGPDIGLNDQRDFGTDAKMIGQADFACGTANIGTKE